MSLTTLEDITGFVDWLFEEASKGAPQAEVPAPAEPPTPSQEPARDSPPHQPADARRPPSGPRTGAPIYQQALSQALPTTSPTGQKRTASARSPSPSGHPPNKSRRTDLPTGPRAMFRDRDHNNHGGGGGSRSLLDRMGPRNGHGPQFNAHDDVQARIDSITNGSPDPNMMLMNGGFPMNGMPGMDIAMGMANPMMLQEMMLNQMAMMSQLAGAMGIMNPATGQFMTGGGFPMQPGMGDMNQQFGGMNGGMGPGGGDGRGRGRGRGGTVRGAARGRGAHTGPHATEPQGEAVAPTLTPLVPMTQPATPIPLSKSAPAVVAPTPLTPSSSTGSSRPGFVAPERPQSPTLCKFALKCTNPICRYSHPSPVATAESGVVLSNDPCEKGKDCKDKDCVKGHVSPAVLNPKGAYPLTSWMSLSFLRVAVQLRSPSLLLTSPHPPLPHRSRAYHADSVPTAPVLVAHSPILDPLATPTSLASSARLAHVRPARTSTLKVVYSRRPSTAGCRPLARRSTSRLRRLAP